jgi:hypothetical protein
VSGVFTYKQNHGSKLYPWRFHLYTEVTNQSYIRDVFTYKQKSRIKAISVRLSLTHRSHGFDLYPWWFHLYTKVMDPTSSVTLSFISRSHGSSLHSWWFHSYTEVTDLSYMRDIFNHTHKSLIPPISVTQKSRIQSISVRVSCIQRSHGFSLYPWRKIWGVHDGYYEEWCLLGCYAVWFL